MCGICGIYNPNNSDGALTISLMSRILRHRGPDDEGYVAISATNGTITPLGGADSRVLLSDISGFNNGADLFLAHRRLSIIDLSAAGHQPMSSPDERIWIVFNGEIYNYRELRSELRSLGHVFRTETDTEVVVAAYVEWGENCLDRFDGMWAFVLYDAHRNALFGSRDRFGVKPLYYVFDQGRFAFASEIKALLAVPGVRARANGSAIYDYIAFGQDYWSDGTTFFDSVYELRPSHAFLWKVGDSSFETYQYYSLPVCEEWESFDGQRAQEHIQTVRERTMKSVARHLIADVPVGSCLSGGIDSSSIVGAISSLLGETAIDQVGVRLKTFTACYPGQSVDESTWAKMMANHIDAEWLTTEPTGDELIRDLEDLVHTQDCPFGSTSIYAQYRVMRRAREAGVTVLLDGQGGDELFTGYIPYYVEFFKEMFARSAWKDLRREWEALSSAPLSRSTLAKLLLRTMCARRMPKSWKRKLVSIARPGTDLMREKFSSKYAEESIERRFGSARGASLNTTLHQLMTFSSLPTLLRYEDRNSMRFSIESRTPFADDRKLIETVFAIPSTYKIHKGYSKWLLREAMKDVLPEPIYSRTDKIGFATPEKEWLTRNRKALDPFMDFLPSEVFDTSGLREAWSHLVSGLSSSTVTQLWRYINMALWIKTYAINNIA